MASENPASAERTNLQQNTTLLVKKGTSMDVLKTLGPAEFGDNVKTAAQLRAILVDKGVMVESDQFMIEDGSLLKREEESSMQWSGVVAEEVLSRHYILNSAH
jgi:hypothetical protein